MRPKMQYDLLIQELKTCSSSVLESIKRYGYGAEFMLLPEDWDKYSKDISKLTFTWSHVKFSNFSDIPNVVDNTPGIYLFVLKPPHNIFDEFSFVMYVGMTDDGLKERLGSGYRNPSSVKPRQNIMRLILDYGDNLFWYYAPIINKTRIELKEIESNLIGYFGDPPINKRDEPTVIADAKKSKMN
jgi:hypothetical protein